MVAAACRRMLSPLPWSRGFGRLICVCLLVLAGGSRSARAEQLAFQSFSQVDGLTNLAVSCLVQDSSGYIMVCTEHGLYAYDGRRFFNLGPQQGLPEGGFVYGLAFSSDRKIIVRYTQRIFVSTRSLDLTNGPRDLHFQAALSDAGLNNEDQTGDIVPWKRGSVFVLSQHLFYVDPGDPLRQPRVLPMDRLIGRPDGAIRNLSPLAGDGDRLWVALADQRICELAPRSVRCFGQKEGLPQAPWLAFHLNADGTLFARSMSLLVHIDPVSGHVDVTSLPNQGKPKSIYLRRPILTTTPSGEVLTQAANGLMIQNGSGWKMLATANGLPSARIGSALFDHENDLWLGAFGAGAFKALGYGLWENRNQRDELTSDSIWQIVRQPGGPLWVASDGGVDALAPAGNAPAGNAPVALRHYDEASYAVAADDSGHIWRSLARSGVSRITTATGEVRQFVLPAVNQILKGAGGRFWFMSEQGVYFLDDAAESQARPQPLPGFSDRISGAALAADGGLWILRRGQLWHRHADGSAVMVALDLRQPDFDMYLVAAAGPDVIWIGGTGGGLYRIALSGDHVVGTTRFNPPDILSNTMVSLVVDRRGWVWVATDSGISVFNGTRWVSANSSDGLIWNDLDQGGLFEDTDGSMWIGTSKGLSHLLDPKQLFNRPTLQPVITSVVLGTRTFQNKAVPFSKQPLLLQFGILNFRSSDTVRFRYHLDGVDEGWADTAVGYARYASVPPGHHRFTVVAYNPLSNQPGFSASVLLRMKQPWWFWWPMITAYGICGIVLIYSLLRLRDGLLVRQRNALQREVELRTREIRDAQAALQLQAMQDSLTRLLTRGEIQKRLVDLLAQADRPHLTVGLLDIDHFKRINDQFGHLAGDDILKEIGVRLNAALRSNEYAGRYGGEEILLVLDLDVVEGIDRIYALKAAACDAPFASGPSTHSVTCSIGVTQARTRDDWESLIGRADSALYRAKAQGRDRVVVAPIDVSKFG